jgi:hypothetical protein
LKNKDLNRALRILIICEAILMICAAYRLSGDVPANSMSCVRDGTMFAAGLVLGPAVTKDL